jgi:hypothetical protein
LRSTSACAKGVTRNRRKFRVFAVRIQVIFAGAAVLALSTMAAATSASAAQQSPAAPASHAPAGKGKGHYAPIKHEKRDYQRACALPARGKMACNVLIRTNVTQQIQPSATPHAIPAGFGYGPSQLQSAYNLPSSTAGSGQTVALIDAFDYPTAAADLATYRSAAGLPACGTGCFSKVNQNGAASPLPPSAGTTGWDVEEALDIDMVSAICPLCHIILVEATSPSTANLGAAVNSAVSLGAKFISNSYGGSESTSDSSSDTQFYNHPGVAITASAGDDGFGVEYPAASKFVTAVGGTSLSTSTNARGWNETVWSGSGSGCSADDAKPTWQTDTGCARRTNNDVAAVADPNTGVAVYNTFSEGGWLEVGGTSASSPIIAATYALAGTPAAGTYPSSYLYAHPSNFYDVTSGSDGTCSPAYLCTGEVGYDGPTGLGTPIGTGAFKAVENTLTVHSPGTRRSLKGAKVSLKIHATDSLAGQSLVYTAKGLPSGLSISKTSGKITGKPKKVQFTKVTVTVSDDTGVSGSTSFQWADGVKGAITSGLSGKHCLASKGGSTRSNNPLEIAKCNGGKAQSWVIYPGLHGEDSIGLAAGNHSHRVGCMGVKGASTASGAAVVTLACSQAGSLLWKPGTGGHLVGMLSAKCLNDPSAGPNGTHLQIATCTVSNREHWNIP